MKYSTAVHYNQTKAAVTDFGYWPGVSSPETTRESRLYTNVTSDLEERMKNLIARSPAIHWIHTPEVVDIIHLL